MCGNIALADGGDVQAVITQCASDVGTFAQIVRFASALELIDGVVRAGAESLVDVVVCAMDVPGMTGVEVAREIHAADEHATVVLCAETSTEAYEAVVARVKGYLVSPIETPAFERVIATCFERTVDFQEHSVVLRCRDKVRRLPFEEFVYAETFNHNQLVHVVGGAQYDMRATSQALFELLGNDPRFFKAGSSCIINLDHVRSVKSGGGVVSFDNGRTCSVPVRLRKAFEEALMRKRA